MNSAVKPKQKVIMHRVSSAFGLDDESSDSVCE